MQEIAVVIVLLVALSYGGRRIYKVFRSAGDPCYGCAGCRNKPKRRKKQIAGIKSSLKIWLSRILCLPLHPHSRNGARCLDLRSSHHTLERADASIALYSLNGALDEWLSLRSAKPSTAVRIRQAPLEKVKG